MSLAITVDRDILGAWEGTQFLSCVRPIERTRPSAPYLTFVWIVVALGALAIFEPAPSDIGIALLIVFGFLNGNLRWNQKLTLPFMLLGLFILANLVSLARTLRGGRG